MAAGGRAALPKVIFNLPEAWGKAVGGAGGVVLPPFSAGEQSPFMGIAIDFVALNRATHEDLGGGSGLVTDALRTYLVAC